MKIRIEFKIEDLWIGVYWKRSNHWRESLPICGHTLDVWVCLIPCLPIHVTKEIVFRT